MDHRELESPLERTPRRRAQPLAWPAIEGDYRAGLLSLRALAQKHGCSHSTIANFAARQGWVRNASPAHQGTPTKATRECTQGWDRPPMHSRGWD